MHTFARYMLIFCAAYSLFVPFTASASTIEGFTSTDTADAPDTLSQAEDIFPSIEINNPTKPSDSSQHVQFLVDNDISVDQEALNDLYAVGESILVRNTVDGDVFALGNIVRVEEWANITGSVRVAANNVNLNSRVTRNVLIFGNVVHIGSEAVLMGNVRIYANQVVIDGVIAGRADIYAKQVTGNGDILAESAITAQSVLLNNVSQPSLITITEYTNKDHKETISARKKDTLQWIGRFFFSAAVGVLVLILMPKKVEAGINRFNTRPVRTLWLSIAWLCIVPALSIVLCITLIGIPFAALLMLLYVLLCMLAPLATGYWLGKKICTDMHVKHTMLNTVLVFLVGLFILTAASQVPYVGWIINICAVIAGVGILISGTKK